MIIRNIRKSDYEAIDRLLLQLHQVDIVGRPELFSEIDHYMPRDSFESLVENNEMITILAEARREILGCCFVSMLDCSGMVKMKTAYIDLIVVDEKHRRKGIGKSLFQAVQKRARKIGAKRIDLMVWSHNQNAVDAYKSYGMVPQRCVYSPYVAKLYETGSHNEYPVEILPFYERGSLQGHTFSEDEIVRMIFSTPASPACKFEQCSGGWLHEQAARQREIQTVHRYP